MATALTGAYGLEDWGFESLRAHGLGREVVGWGERGVAQPG